MRQGVWQRSEVGWRLWRHGSAGVVGYSLDKRVDTRFYRVDSRRKERADQDFRFVGLFLLPGSLDGVHLSSDVGVPAASVHVAVVVDARHVRLEAGDDGIQDVVQSSVDRSIGVSVGFFLVHGFDVERLDGVFDLVEEGLSVSNAGDSQRYVHVFCFLGDGRMEVALGVDEVGSVRVADDVGVREYGLLAQGVDCKLSYGVGTLDEVVSTKTLYKGMGYFVAMQIFSLGTGFKE